MGGTFRRASVQADAADPMPSSPLARAYYPMRALTLAALALLVATALPLQAQTVPERPLPSLDPSLPEPLKPLPPVPRPITPLEQREIRVLIDLLDTQARALARSGELEGAFELWFRSARLAQRLGPDEELPVLRRLATALAEHPRKPERQALEKRLRALEPTLPWQPPRSRLLLADTYREIRNLPQALGLYRGLLDRIPPGQSPVLESRLLGAIARLELGRFEEGPAIEALRRRLALLLANPTLAAQPLPPVSGAPKLTELQWTLLELLQALEQTGGYAEAAQLRQGALTQVPPARQDAWRLALARDQRQSGAEPEAVLTLQALIRDTAVRKGQTGNAAIHREALTELAQLYRQRQQSDDALVVLDLLAREDRRNGNTYGLMETQVAIARLQWQQGNREAAQAALAQASAAATRLSLSYAPLNDLRDDLAKPEPPQK